MASQVLLSVVAPCFNEAAGLPEFHRRVSAACRALPGLHDSWELVLINDGSRDTTRDVMQRLAWEDSHVVAINLARNYGHQVALTAGLNLCRGEQILIIDADLQDPPELLAGMMRVMDEQEADVVSGQRRMRSGETRLKLTTAALFYRILQRLVEIEIPLDTGDFRLMNRRTLDVLNKMPERDRFIRGLVSWIGLRQVPFLYDREARYAGSSNYPLLKMARFALDAVTSFSIVPAALRLARRSDHRGDGVAFAHLHGRRLVLRRGGHRLDEYRDNPADHRRGAASDAGRHGRVSRPPLHGIQAPSTVRRR